MKAGIRIAMLLTLAVGGTIGLAAREAGPAVAQTKTATADESMAPYRALAAETLEAFKAHDAAATKKKARELEVSWDSHTKALKKKSPEVWGQIDTAMDGFIKPAQEKSPDAAKVQAGYDTFIAKLKLAD
jgi:hypothetical protein